MEIIQQFGVEPVLLVAQIINFLILLFILKKFAYKPIFKMLSDRKKTIENSLKQAEDAKRALDEALEKEKEILKNAQNSASKILQDTKVQADEMIENAREQAKTQMDQMIDDARRQLSQDAKDMEKRLAQKTAQMATDIVKNAAKSIFTEKEQKEVIKKMAKKMGMK